MASTGPPYPFVPCGQRPSSFTELADPEPIWAWGEPSQRIPYNFSGYGTEIATTTHDGKPNWAFGDGHVERQYKAFFNDSNRQWW
jgi:prepilin-type processing-associated H-X9-DG protein